MHSAPSSRAHRVSPAEFKKAWQFLRVYFGEARAVEFAAGIIPLERYFRTAKSFDRGIDETQFHPGRRSPPPESTRRFTFLWNSGRLRHARIKTSRPAECTRADGSKRRDVRYIGLFSNKFNNPISFFVDLLMHASRLYAYICKICCSFKELLSSFYYELIWWAGILRGRNNQPRLPGEMHYVPLTSWSIRIAVSKRKNQRQSEQTIFYTAMLRTNK